MDSKLSIFEFDYSKMNTERIMDTQRNTYQTKTEEKLNTQRNMIFRKTVLPPRLNLAGLKTLGQRSTR